MNIKEFAEKACAAVDEMLEKEVYLKEIDKLNGVTHYALIIKDTQSNIAPTLYLEHFYQIYQKTGDWAETINKIVTAYDTTSFPKHFDMEWFKDFNSVQKLIFQKLINYEANKILLNDVPHTRYLDFAIVYCVYYENAETGNGSILIHNSHLDLWQCTSDELARLAEENTPRIYPLTIFSIGELLPGSFAGTVDITSIPMYVMSNKDRVNGAITLRYKNALRSFSEQHNADVAILPSSVHEVILLPLNNDKDFDSLKETVRLINRTQVPQEDFLSDNVYLYRRTTDCVEIA